MKLRDLTLEHLERIVAGDFNLELLKPDPDELAVLLRKYHGDIRTFALQELHKRTQKAEQALQRLNKIRLTELQAKLVDEFLEHPSVMLELLHELKTLTKQLQEVINTWKQHNQQQ